MNLFAPSLLDKLLGVDIDSQGRGTTSRMTVEQVKESVARDIETLLNARPGFEPAQLTDFPQASKSLLTYGLTDIASLSMASDRDRQRINESIRLALANHEPRLVQVEVTVHRTTAVGGGLRFSIRARLRLTPSTEPVAFDAVLHPGSLRYAVSRSRPRSASATPADARG
jgi:type VI secretion system protein ImpF